MNVARRTGHGMVPPERAAGIEPAPRAWKAHVIPFHHARLEPWLLEAQPQVKFGIKNSRRARAFAAPPRSQAHHRERYPARRDAGRLAGTPCRHECALCATVSSPRPCRHSRSDAALLVDADEVAIHEVECNRIHVRFDLFGECICQPSEAAHEARFQHSSIPLDFKPTHYRAAKGRRRFPAGLQAGTVPTIATVAAWTFSRPHRRAPGCSGKSLMREAFEMQV